MIFWSVVGLATVILIGIAFALVATPSVRYRLFGDADSLDAALARQIRPGASQENVVSVLGPGEPVKDAQKFRAAIRRRPHGFPDGVTDRDTFLRYRCAGGATYLQFRDGRLINHDPSRIEAAADVKVLGGP